MHIPTQGSHRSIRSLESGAAMATALAVTMILALITVALVNLAVSEYTTATTLDASAQAFLAAEAGGQRAVAFLRGDGDWSNNVTSPPWTAVYTNEPFPNAASGVTPVGQFSVSVGPPPAGYDAQTNIVVRSVGRVRRSTRTIQFMLHRLTAADFTLYVVNTVDLTAIPGGGSLQFHGSAYFESDLTLKGSIGAGIFNDRVLFSADAPNYLNQLYVKGNLDMSTGNPTVGSPYWSVHVQGSIMGSSTNFDPVNLDGVVPSAALYPDVVAAVRDALANPGNLLATLGGTVQFVACRWNGGGWTSENRDHLTLSGTTDAAAFFLPRVGTTCADYPTTIAAVRAADNFMLMWDPQNATAQLVFANPNLPVYIPGTVRIDRDVQYQGKGTIVVANDQDAIPANVTAQNSCAVDFNGDGSCSGTSSSGRTLKARIPPCNGSPGVDNPATTFPTADLAAFIVNGGAYSNLNSSACGQEVNLAAIVGDQTATACFESQKKLQIYGFLMTKCLSLGQVPDFWQMPDMLSNLPKPIKDVVVAISNPVQPRSWQELF